MCMSSAPSVKSIQHRAVVTSGTTAAPNGLLNFDPPAIESTLEYVLDNNINFSNNSYAGPDMSGRQDHIAAPLPPAHLLVAGTAPPTRRMIGLPVQRNV